MQNIGCFLSYTQSRFKHTNIKREHRDDYWGEGNRQRRDGGKQWGGVDIT